MEKIGQEIITFLDKFVNVFIVEGTTIEMQQALKFGALLVMFFLFLGILYFLVKVIKCAIEPLVNGLKVDVKYLFFSFVTFLVFVFSSEMTFKGACIALFFLIIAAQIYPIVKESLRFVENREKKNSPNQN